MLSHTAEYALRAVRFLAVSPEEVRTIRQIAADTKVPADYLSKVMQSLASSGIVSSQRGKRGGFRLAQPLESLTLLDVTEAVAPTQVLSECPRKLPAHKDRLCTLHQCCREATLAFNQVLGETRLADVLDDDVVLDSLARR